MEITGKVLREVEFRDRLRGYDTDEVDEFLERVAVAIDELNAEHTALRSRAEAAERHAEQVPPIDDDGIRRTLVLAQRTADLAVREARAEADQLLEDARARSQALLSEAEEEAARLREEADRDVRSRTSRLSDHHERLTREIRILEALLESERTRITQSLSEALRFVGESMGVSDEVATAVGSAASPEGAGPEPASRGELGAFAPLDPGRGGELGLSPPLGRSARGAPAPAGAGAVPSEIPPPPVAAPGGPAPGQPGTPPPVTLPAGTSGSSGASGEPSSSGGSDAAEPAGDGESHGWPAGGSPEDGPASGGQPGRSRLSNGASARHERDIEAELLEDAGLAAGHQPLWDEPPPAPASRREPAPRRGSPPAPPGVGEDDALWARWAAGGGPQLDPLADPPPTQAYRIDPDGNWPA